MSADRHLNHLRSAIANAAFACRTAAHARRDIESLLAAWEVLEVPFAGEGAQTEESPPSSPPSSSSSRGPETMKCPGSPTDGPAFMAGDVDSGHEGRNDEGEGGDVVWHGRELGVVQPYTISGLVFPSNSLSGKDITGDHSSEAHQVIPAFVAGGVDSGHEGRNDEGEGEAEPAPDAPRTQTHAVVLASQTPHAERMRALCDVVDRFGGDEMWIKATFRDLEERLNCCGPDISLAIGDAVAAGMLRKARAMRGLARGNWFTTNAALPEPYFDIIEAELLAAAKQAAAKPDPRKNSAAIVAAADKAAPAPLMK